MTVANSRPAETRSVGRDWIGSSLGLLVFLAGVGLLLVVFRLAYEMFATPPTVALAIDKGQTLNLAAASNGASAILVRVILLVLMAVTGSLVANRGISLYGRCHGHGKEA